MIRKDLYISIIERVRLGYMAGPLAVHEQPLYDAAKTLKNFAEMARIVRYSLNCNPAFFTLLNTLKDCNSAEEEYKEVVSVTHLKFFTAKEYRHNFLKRTFVYNGSLIACFDTEELHRTDSKYEEDIMVCIEKIAHANTRLDTLLSSINTMNEQSYYLIYNESLIPHDRQADSEKLYHYCLLEYLNSPNKLSLNEKIAGRSATSFSVALSYNHDVEYRQYMDIYDVMNEWQHTTDYLMSFLKMYQIMEFLAYRILLKKIVDTNSIQHSFLRSVMRLDSKYSKAERMTFVDTLKDVFLDFDTCRVKITADVEVFVEKHFGKKEDSNKRYLRASQSGEHLRKPMLQFIYDVRCSLVHNKDSEFHINYNNIEEYKDIIPLIKDVQNVVSNRIIEIISDPNSPCSYEKQTMELF